jgi:hypothetical protein
MGIGLANGVEGNFDPREKNRSPAKVGNTVLKPASHAEQNGPKATSAGPLLKPQVYGCRDYGFSSGPDVELGGIFIDQTFQALIKTFDSKTLSRQKLLFPCIRHILHFHIFSCFDNEL